MPIDRRKYRERYARIAAFLERSRESITRSGGGRRPAAAAAVHANETAVALADDDRKRALQRATAALKAVQTEGAAASAADVNVGGDRLD